VSWDRPALINVMPELAREFQRLIAAVEEALKWKRRSNPLQATYPNTFRTPLQPYEPAL